MKAPLTKDAKIAIHRSRALERSRKGSDQRQKTIRPPKTEETLVKMEKTHQKAQAYTIGDQIARQESWKRHCPEKERDKISRKTWKPFGRENRLLLGRV